MENKGKKFSKFIKYWPIMALIFIGLAGIGIYQIVNSNSGVENIPGETISTIRTGSIRLSAFGSGTLISANEVSFGFENGGIVEEILVEKGDEVKEGEILAILDDADLVKDLIEAEAALRELTSDSAIAGAALQVAEAQKAVLSAESELRFLISPYVFKSEIRLQEARAELISAEKDAELYPSQEANQRIIEAQEAVDHAELSLAMNWETYYEEYVPDFFNFPWRDRFGFWHDYFDPPSETEVALVWAELAGAKAWVEEAQIYLAALTKSELPDDPYGSQLTKLENAGEKVVDAQEALDAASLKAPMTGVVIELELHEKERISIKNVITIAQLDPPTLEASFDEGDWSLVKVGNQVEVIFDALPEKTYSGKVVFVDPTLKTRQNSTTTINALVELDINQTGWVDLPLFSSGSIEVIAGEAQDAILLPTEGLEDDSGSFGTVYLKEDGEYVIQEVELGLRDVLYVEVTRGLSIGDVVLIGSIE